MAFTGSEVLNDVTMMHMNSGIKRKRMEVQNQVLDDQLSASKLIKKGRGFASYCIHFLSLLVLHHITYEYTVFVNMFL